MYLSDTTAMYHFDQTGSLFIQGCLSQSAVNCLHSDISC